MDSRGKSLTEAGVNTGIGYWINCGANLAILPIVCVPIAQAYQSGDWTELGIINLYVGVIYTVVSVVRQYGLRRLFERFGENENFYTLTKKMIRKIKP